MVLSVMGTRCDRSAQAAVGGLPDGAVHQRKGFGLGDFLSFDDHVPADVLVDHAEGTGDGGRTQSHREIVVAQSQGIGDHRDEPAFHLVVHHQVGGAQRGLGFGHRREPHRTDLVGDVLRCQWILSGLAR